jgi:hypothetical protein
MCTRSISSSSELYIDILNTIDDQIDRFDALGIL